MGGAFHKILLLEDDNRNNEEAQSIGIPSWEKGPQAERVIEASNAGRGEVISQH